MIRYFTFIIILFLFVCRENLYPQLTDIDDGRGIGMMHGTPTLHTKSLREYDEPSNLHLDSILKLRNRNVFDSHDSQVLHSIRKQKLSGNLSARYRRNDLTSIPVVLSQKSASAVPEDAYWSNEFAYPGLVGTIYIIALSPSGDVYVGGAITSAGEFALNHIVKWDGTKWLSLEGGVNAPVYAIAFDRSGNLYAGGEFTSAGGVSANHVAKWDGIQWSALGSGVNDDVLSIAIDQNGNLFAGGAFSVAGGASSNNIAEWDGTNWSALGSGTNNPVWSVTFGIDGDLYAGGTFDSAGGLMARGIAKWDGMSWSTLGEGWWRFAFSLAGDTHGNIYAGGAGVAKWDGTSWSQLGTGFDGNVYTIGVSSDSSGQIYVGGDFTMAGVVWVNHVAKWDGNSWSALGSGRVSMVNAIAVGHNYGNKVFAGGAADGGGDGTDIIREWNGSDWSEMLNTGDYNGMGFRVESMAFSPTGDLYAGGEFTEAGSVSANYIAKWDGKSWSAISSGLNGGVPALVFDPNANLYVGGYFDSAGGVYTSLGIAKWDGTSWSAVGSGPNGRGWPLAFDSSGNLYATCALYVPPNVDFLQYVAKWNGTAWDTSGNEVNNFVRAIAISPKGDLYAGGDFTVVGGVQANHIARFDGTSWSAVGGGVNGSVCAFAFDANQNIFVAGAFDTAGGMRMNNIAKWDGTSWSTLGTGTNDAIFGLAISPKGDLYAGGVFTVAGGLSANYVAKWDGSSWSSLGSGTDYFVDAIAMNPISNCDLFVGGWFNLAGGKASSYIARWTPSLIPMDGGWNIVSVPFKVNDFRKGVLYPGAISNAFAYDGSYVIKDTLKNGVGYWLRFNNAINFTVNGTPLTSDTIDVLEGWNLIGSISASIPTTNIRSDEPDMVTSRYFGYRTGYFTTDTVQPGEGYWVKVSRAGKLILSSVRGNSTANHIQIVSISELPPAPPGGVVSRPQISQQFYLEQNYPNPFNPVTMIHYQLPVKCFISLKVYNILGGEVMTLANGVQDQGYKSATLDASKLSSGVYFYKLSAKLPVINSGRSEYSFVDVKKMLIIK